MNCPLFCSRKDVLWNRRIAADVRFLGYIVEELSTSRFPQMFWSEAGAGCG